MPPAYEGGSEEEGAEGEEGELSFSRSGRQPAASPDVQRTHHVTNSPAFKCLPKKNENMLTQNQYVSVYGGFIAFAENQKHP